MSSLLSILSPRNVTLFVFILVVLFLGATFNVQVGPESFALSDFNPSETTATSANVPSETTAKTLVASTSTPKPTSTSSLRP